MDIVFSIGGGSDGQVHSITNIISQLAASNSQLSFVDQSRINLGNVTVAALSKSVIALQGSPTNATVAQNAGNIANLVVSAATMATNIASASIALSTQASSLVYQQAFNVNTSAAISTTMKTVASQSAGISQQLTAEINRAVAAESNNNNSILAEVSRAIAAEASIQVSAGELSTSVSSLSIGNTALSAMQSTVTNVAPSSISTAVYAETSRALGSESVMSTAAAAASSATYREISRATSAETLINNTVTFNYYTQAQLSSMITVFQSTLIHKIVYCEAGEFSVIPLGI